MQAQEAHGSASATQELLPRPAPANKNARVHCGRRNIAFPERPLPEDQVLQANRRCRRLREAVRGGNLRSWSVCPSYPNQKLFYANRRTARKRSSRVKGFVT